jgi:hypothetical protein
MQIDGQMRPPVSLDFRSPHQAQPADWWRFSTDSDAQHVVTSVGANLHPDSIPPEPYVIANVFETDALRTFDGWRFQTMNLRPVWSSGQSHIDIDATEQ